VRRFKSNLKRGKFIVCSVKCRHKLLSTYYRGENSPFWRGGHLDYYLTKEWITIRDNVLRKWGRRCMRCGSEENINVHHIITYKERQEFLTLMHFFVLCAKCHKKVEGKGIEEQFNIVFGS